MLKLFRLYHEFEFCDHVYGWNFIKIFSYSFVSYYILSCPDLGQRDDICTGRSVRDRLESPIHKLVIRRHFMGAEESLATPERPMHSCTMYLMAEPMCIAAQRG